MLAAFIKDLPVTAPVFLAILVVIKEIIFFLSNRMKRVISRNPLKIVEIRRISLNRPTWLRHKIKYFMSSLFCIFYMLFLSIVKVKRDTPILFLVFSVYIVLLYSIYCFCLCWLMGKKPDDAKYIFSNEIEMRIDTNTQHLFQYITGVLYSLRVYTFDFCMNDGLLEACIKYWRIIPCRKLKFHIQQMEDHSFLVRVTAKSLNLEDSTKILNQLIKRMVPDPRELLNSKTP